MCIDKRSLKFSYKYKTLRKIWKVLDPDLIALTETQINPDLLDASYNIPTSLFQLDLYIVKIDNNRNKLIGKRQQGRVLSAVQGDLCAIAKSMEGNPTGLSC